MSSTTGIIYDESMADYRYTVHIQFNLLTDHVQRWSKKFVLGCVNGPRGQRQDLAT